MDLGCCFGQDLRLFAAHGAPTNRMYGVDINKEVWDLGYELFKDRDKMQAQFVEADIFDKGSPLVRMQEKCDIIIACQFFHLFSWNGQKEALSCCVRLSRIDSVVIGYQRGQDEAQVVQRSWGDMFIHDLQSFQQLWALVEEETGTRWSMRFSTVSLLEWGMEPEDIEWMPLGCNFIQFVCQRIS